MALQLDEYALDQSSSLQGCIDPEEEKNECNCKVTQLPLEGTPENEFDGIQNTRCWYTYKDETPVINKHNAKYSHADCLAVGGYYLARPENNKLGKQNLVFSCKEGYELYDKVTNQLFPDNKYIFNCTTPRVFQQGTSGVINIYEYIQCKPTAPCPESAGPPPNCKEYDTTICQDGMYLCRKCNENSFMNMQSKKCDSCHESYSLVGDVCQKCQDPNDANSVSISNSKCFRQTNDFKVLSCKDGFYPNRDNNKCEKCQPSAELQDCLVYNEKCSQVDDSTVLTCKECRPGFYSVGYGLYCQECAKTDNNCEEWDDVCTKDNRQKVCKSCKVGFQINTEKNTCEPCSNVKGCLEHIPNKCERDEKNVLKKVCRKCTDELFPEQGACKPCHPNKNCKVSKPECDSSNVTVCGECHASFFYNKNDNSCTSCNKVDGCIESAENCVGQELPCVQCNASTYLSPLSNGNVLNECIRCDSIENCLEYSLDQPCSQTNARKCVKCQIGFTLDEDNNACVPCAENIPKCKIYGACDGLVRKCKEYDCVDEDVKHCRVYTDTCQVKSKKDCKECETNYKKYNIDGTIQCVEMTLEEASNYTQSILNEEGKTDGGIETNTIIGAAAGSFSLLLLVVGFSMFMYRRYAKKKEEKEMNKLNGLSPEDFVMADLGLEMKTDAEYFESSEDHGYATVSSSNSECSLVSLAATKGAGNGGKNYENNDMNYANGLYHNNNNNSGLPTSLSRSRLGTNQYDNAQYRDSCGSEYANNSDDEEYVPSGFDPEFNFDEDAISEYHDIVAEERKTRASPMKPSRGLPDIERPLKPTPPIKPVRKQQQGGDLIDLNDSVQENTCENNGDFGFEPLVSLF